MNTTVHTQYATSDLLTTRLDTHRRYSERDVDLDAECAALMGLRGDEAVLDVGSGPGRFEAHLRARGHTGRLACVDQSRAMMAEAAASLRAAGHALDVLLGDAQRLPVAGGAVDWVVARHVLYHVPDIPAALREFRRALRPGGRLLVATNAGHNYAGILSLWDDLCAAFALPRGEVTTESFRTENAEPILRAVFSVVEPHILTNAFVFAEPAPIVRYLATLIPALPAAPDEATVGRMLAWLDHEAAARLAARGGRWRDPKDVGVYVCRAG